MSDLPAGMINVNIRKKERGSQDIGSIYSILDQALVCHVGFVQDGVPYVIPHNFGRVGDQLVMHGALGGRLMKHILNGGEVCIEVTILDSLVLARSLFQHSVNYRSVMVFGKGRALNTHEEKNTALKAISDQLMKGRWEECRLPNEKELNATAVVSIPIDVATAKINNGMPDDKKEDLDFPVWAGILPLSTEAGEPVTSDGIAEGLLPSEEIRNYKKNGVG